jgi:hypothetical protein
MKGKGTVGAPTCFVSYKIRIDLRKSFSAGPPACLGRRPGDSRAGRQCSSCRTSRGSQTKVTAAKKYTKIPLGQAQGGAYFYCLDVSANM